MAKDKNDLEHDDLDQLDDFDFDDFDLDIDPGKDDRSPITRVSSGFATGAVDNLIDPSDLPRKLKKVLPDDYESSIDVAKSGIDTGVKLYDVVRQETSQGIKDFKKASSKILESNKSKLPKGIADRLSRLLSSDDDSTKLMSDEQQRQMQTDQELAAIFGSQIENESRIHDEQQAEGIAKEVSTIKRHKDEMGELFSIRKLIDRQVTYQDQINSRYQRKSLELQYRHFYVADRMLKLSEEHSRTVKEGMANLVKNSALPDYRKIELGERSTQMLKDKMLGGIHNKASEYLGDVGGFFNRFSDNLVKKVREKAKGFGSQLSEMAGMMDMMGDNSEYIDSLQMAGSTVGNFAMGKGFGVGAERVKGLAGLAGLDERIIKTGLRANTFVQDLPRKMNAWANITHDDGTIFGDVKSLVADSIGRHNLDSNIRSEGVAGLDKPAIFDNQTRKSIVEVIPGYLSRILGEITNIRQCQGCEDDPDNRVEYDVLKNRFSTAKKFKQNILESALPKASLERTSAHMNALIGQIDSDNELSDEAAFELSKFLMRQNLNGRELDFIAMSDEDNLNDINPKNRSEIANVFRKRFGITETTNKETGEVRKGYDDSVKTLRLVRDIKKNYNETLRDIPDPKSFVEGVGDLGHIDKFEELGLVTQDSKGRTTLDYDKVFNMLHNGTYDDSVDPSKLSANRKRASEDFARMQEEERLELIKKQEEELKKQENFRNSLIGKKIDATKQWGKEKTAKYLNLFKENKLSEDDLLKLEESMGMTPGSLKNTYVDTKNRVSGVISRGREELSSATNSVLNKADEVSNRLTQVQLQEGVATPNDRSWRDRFMDTAETVDKSATYIATGERTAGITDAIKKSKENLSQFKQDALQEVLGDSNPDNKKSNIILPGSAMSTNIRLPDSDLGSKVIKLGKRDTSKIFESFRYVEHSTLVEMGFVFNRSKHKKNLLEILLTLPMNLSKKMLDFDAITIGDNESSSLLGGAMAGVIPIEGVGSNVLFINGDVLLDSKALSFEERRSSLVEMIVHEHTHLKQKRKGLLNIPTDTEVMEKGFYESNVTWKGDDNYPIAEWLLPGKKYLDSDWEKEAFEKGWRASHIQSTGKDLSKSAMSSMWSKLKGYMDQTRPDSLEARKQMFEANGIPWRYDNEGNLINLDDNDSKEVYDEYLSDGQDSKFTGTSTVGITSTVTKGSESGGNSFVNVLNQIRDSLSDKNGTTIRDDINSLRENGELGEGSLDKVKVDIMAAILEQVELVNTQLGGDKDVSGMIARGAKRTRSMIGKSFVGAKNLVTGYFKMWGKAGSGTVGMMGKIKSFAMDKLTKGKAKVMDIYVKGKEHPIITEVGLKGREYYDSASGKIIESIQDIEKLKGDVMRRDPETGKIELVARAEDFKNGLFDRIGKKLPSSSTIVSKLVSLKDKALAGVGMLFKPYQMAGRAAVKTYNTVKDFLTQLPDVYVKGEPTPRLLSTVIRNGGYVNGQGKVIQKLKDVDGDIYDLNGNIVLSLNDMRVGLVDSKGRNLSFLSRQFDRVKKVAGAVKNFAVSVGKKAIGGIKKAFGGIRSLAGSGISKVKGMFGFKDAKDIELATHQIQDAQLNTLTEIRDILRRAYPKGRKYDTDGDGLRDGSWRARMKKRKEAKDKKDSNANKANDGKSSKKEDGPGMLAKLAGLIPGLGGGDSGGGGMGLGDAMAAGQLGKYALGKAGRLLKGAGKLGWGAVKGVGRLGLGAGKIAGRAGLGLGRAVAGRAALALAGKAAAVVGGVLSAPVLIGAAAVGALAIGGYLLYKHLTKKKFGPLGKMRLAQYGFSHENEKDLQRILYLEDKLKEHLKDKGGELTLDVPKEAMEEISKGFGVDVKNDKESYKYLRWFTIRFAPVYLSHQTALKQFGGEDFFKFEEKASAADKLEYYELVKKVGDGENDPYRVKLKPVGKGPLDFGKEKVLALIDSVGQQLSDEEANAKKTEDKSPATESKENDSNVEESKDSVVSQEKTVVEKVLDTQSSGSLEQTKVGGDIPKGDITSKEGYTPTESFIDKQSKNFHTKNYVKGGSNLQPTVYSKLPVPRGNGSYPPSEKLFAYVSKATGVDAGLLATLAGASSQFNTVAYDKQTGGKGLFLITDSKWKELRGKFGEKYGIPNTVPAYDPRASTLLFAEDVRNNHKLLQKTLGDNISDVDYYLAHLVGGDIAGQLSKLDDTAKFGEKSPMSAKKFESIFFDGKEARTKNQILSAFDKRLSVYRNRYSERARGYADDDFDVKGYLSGESKSNKSDGGSKVLKMADYREDEVIIPSNSEKPNVGLKNTVEEAIVTQTARMQEHRQTSTTDKVVDSQHVKEDIIKRQKRNDEIQNAQSIRRSQQSIENLDKTNELLSKSLKVQLSMDETLKRVVTILEANKVHSIEEPSQPKKPNMTRNSLKQAKEVEPPAVDLKRAQLG